MFRVLGFRVWVFTDLGLRLRGLGVRVSGFKVCGSFLLGRNDPTSVTL